LSCGVVPLAPISNNCQITPLSASIPFLSTRRKQILFAHFHASHPAKNKTLSTSTMPHYQLNTLMLKHDRINDRDYNVGKIVTKPTMMLQNRDLFLRTS
jgi:hypothetical protein